MTAIVDKMKRISMKPKASPFTPKDKKQTGYPQLLKNLEQKQVIPVVLKLFQFFDYDTRQSAGGCCKLWRAVAKSLDEAESDAEDEEEGGGEAGSDSDEYEAEDGPSSGKGKGKGKEQAKKPPAKKPPQKQAQRGKALPTLKEKGGSDDEYDEGSDGEYEEDDDMPPPPPPKDEVAHISGIKTKSPLKKPTPAPALPTSPSGSEKKDLDSFLSYMKKRSNSNRHIWQRRLFVFNPPSQSTGGLARSPSSLEANRPNLRYYKSEKEYAAQQTPQGILYFDQIRGVTLAKSGKGAEGACRIDVELASKGVHLIAENPADANKWIKIMSYYMPPPAPPTALVVNSSSPTLSVASPSSSELRKGEVFQGVLSKKSPASRVIWQKRYFVLTTNVTPVVPHPRLEYYKSEKEKNSNRAGARLGYIELRSIYSVDTVSGGSEKGAKFDLVLCLQNTPGGEALDFKTISLMADNVALCKQWVQIIDKYAKKERESEKERQLATTPKKGASTPSTPRSPHFL